MHKACIALHGGLGNTLHQIAFAIYLENIGVDIRFDFSRFSCGSSLKGLSEELNDYVYSRRSDATKFMPPINGRLRFLSRPLAFMFGYNSFYVDYSSTSVNLRNFLNDSRLTNPWFFGYFQTREFAEIAYNQILAFMDWGSETSEEIGVHIRLGDYRKIGVDLEKNYYKRAIESARNLVGDVPVKIYSNELTAAENIMSDLVDDIEFVRAGNDYEHFKCLSKSQAIVCSSSTFSWWSAFISETSKVFYPSPWDKNNSMTDSLIIPDSRKWFPIER